MKIKAKQTIIDHELGTIRAGEVRTVNKKHGERLGSLVEVLDAKAEPKEPELAPDTVGEPKVEPNELPDLEEIPPSPAE